MREPTLAARLGAEFLGTFVLLFGGCGSAILAAKFLTDDNVQIGIGFVGVSLAFGLSVLAGAYAFGHVSGGISIWFAGGGALAQVWLFIVAPIMEQRLLVARTRSSPELRVPMWVSRRIQGSRLASRPPNGPGNKKSRATTKQARGARSEASDAKQTNTGDLSESEHHIWC
jgi:hypothetical protein